MCVARALLILCLLGGCSSQPRFVHVGGTTNSYTMFDNETGQDCWAGPNEPPSQMPTCRSLADGGYSKPKDDVPGKSLKDAPVTRTPPCPGGVPAGSKTILLTTDELAKIVGKQAGFNGTYVSYSIQNDSRKCLTAIVSSFEFQTKSGGEVTITTTEQFNQSLSPGWRQDGFSLYVLENYEYDYSDSDPRSVHNGEVNYKNPRLPVALLDWRVTKAWGFDMPK